MWHLPFLSSCCHWVGVFFVGFICFPVGFPFKACKLKVCLWFCWIYLESSYDVTVLFSCLHWLEEQNSNFHLRLKHNLVWLLSFWSHYQECLVLGADKNIWLCFTSVTLGSSSSALLGFPSALLFCSFFSGPNSASSVASKWKAHWFFCEYKVGCRCSSTSPSESFSSLSHS